MDSVQNGGYCVAGAVGGIVPCRLIALITRHPGEVDTGHSLPFGG